MRNGESGPNPGSAYQADIALSRINFSRGNKISLDDVVMKAPKGVVPMEG